MNLVQSSLDKIIKKKKKFYEVDEDIYKDLVSTILNKSDLIGCLLHRVNNMILTQKADYQLKLFELIDRFFVLIPAFQKPFLKILQKSMVKLIGSFQGKKLESNESKLKHNIISIIVNWNEKYGKELHLIGFCLNFLRSKFLKDVINAENLLKKKKKEANLKRKLQESEKKRTYQHLVDVLKDNKFIIIASINTIENCFNLLIPDVTENVNTAQNLTSSEYLQNKKMLFPGIDDELDIPIEFSGPSCKISNKITEDVAVNLSLDHIVIEIYENFNNSDVIRTLTEEIKVLQKRFVPLLNNIIKKLKNFENSEKDLEPAYKLSWSALDCLRKFDQLKIIHNDLSSNLVSSDSENDDCNFIDVP